jgi:hypothetical protein
VLPATVPSGRCLLGSLCFLPVMRPPAHFFSEISRLRCARDLGRRLRTDPIRVPKAFHPTGVGLFRSEFGPFIGLLVSQDALVGWAPSNLDDDARPGSPHTGTVSSYHVYCRLPSDIRDNHRSTITGYYSVALVTTILQDQGSSQNAGERRKKNEGRKKKEEGRRKKEYY